MSSNTCEEPKILKHQIDSYLEYLYVKNDQLEGVFFFQDYIDSMEGATLSGRQAAAKICEAAPSIYARRGVGEGSSVARVMEEAEVTFV